MKENILTHNRSKIALVCIMLTVFGCFTFPIWNFANKLPAYLRIFNLLIACSAYAEIGRLEKKFLIKKGRGAALNLGLTLAGFACRFLLEYGEVSNVYNFTPMNMAVHLLAAVLIPLWAAIRQ